MNTSSLSKVFKMILLILALNDSNIMNAINQTTDKTATDFEQVNS